MKSHRLLFYSHDTFGLGHFRRSLTIASYLQRHLPDVAVLILTGLDTAYAFESPPRIDFVKLPAVKKVGPDEYRSRHLRLSFNRVRRLREHLIKAVAKSFDPHVVIVDNVPRGVDGELLPTFEFLRKYRPATKVVLTLRDVLDEPQQIVPQWREWGVYDLLANHFHEIWVAGSRELFDPTRLYEFPEPVAQRTRFCGYVVQRTSAAAAAAIEREFDLGQEPLAVVSGGGGGDGYPLVNAYADALDGLSDRGIRSAVFLGPDMPPTQRNDLKRRLLPRSRQVLLFDFRPDLVAFLAHAAVTVSMAGYNTMAEVLAHHRRGVVVPRVFPRREQWLRARAFEKLGLVRTIDPDELTPDALGAAVRSGVAEGVLPASPIDFGGLRRVARRCRLLLGLPDPAEA